MFESKVLIRVAAAVVALAAFGAASILANSAPSTPTTVETTAVDAPAAYQASQEDVAQQARDPWDKESKPTITYSADTWLPTYR
jgi:hypothetical protein